MDPATVSPERAKGSDVSVGSPKTQGPLHLSFPWLATRRGQLLTLGGAAVALLVPALWLATWWAPVPLLSLAGVISWRTRYGLAGLVGGGVGLGFWTAELLWLPQGAVSRLTGALGGAEGFSPTVMFLLGPLLFGIVTALGSLTVAGSLRTIRAFHA